MVRIIIILALVLAALSQTAFVVPEWEQGIILQFGKPVRTIAEPGLYFKVPFVQDFVAFDKRILESDARPEEYITLDKKRLIVDAVSRWKVADPLKFYRTVQTYTSAVARLNETILGRLRQEVASHDFKSFIREERENIMATVTHETAESAKRYGIDVVDVRIKRVDLPSEVQDSVFKRMQAERQRIANRYRAEGKGKATAIKAKADSEKKVIMANAYSESETLRGEGDAEASAIYAEAFGKDEEFYSFLRHLQLYENVLGKDSTVLLRPDSNLLKYLETAGVDEKNKGR